MSTVTVLAVLAVLAGCVWGKEASSSSHTHTGVSSSDASVTSHVGASVSVDSSGAATWKLALPGPPGINNHVPPLALAFSSRQLNRDTVIGRGVSIHGVTHVHRCAKSLARDNVTRGVQFDDTDRYCLGGARLVSVDGTYGANGTVYFSEVDTFTRVVSYTDPSVGVTGGPSMWVAHTKAGEVMEFGATPDSRIMATGEHATVVNVWAVSKRGDLIGNYASFSYRQDSPDGSYAVSHVNYTANDAAGVPPANSIEFEYDPLPQAAKWMRGTVFRPTLRLASIKSYGVGHSLYTDMRLTYTQDCRTNASLLATVTECVSTGACGRPMKLYWDAADAASCSRAYTSSPSPPFNVSTFDPNLAELDVSRVHLVDVDSNGLMDFIRINGLGTTEPISVWLTQPGAQSFKELSGPSVSVDSDMATAKLDIQRVKFISLNGDHYPEMYHMMGGSEPDRIYIGVGNGTFDPNYVAGPTVPIALAPSVGSVDMSRIMFGDMNGDGITDMYRVNGNSSSAVPDTMYLFHADLTFTEVAGPATTPVRLGEFGSVDTHRVHLIDMDGDKLTDVYVQLGNGPDPVPDLIYHNQGDLTFAQKPGPSTRVSNIYSEATLDESRLKFMDVNLDGAKDVYVVTLGDPANPGPTRDLVYLHHGNFSYDSTAVLGPLTNVSPYPALAPLDVGRVKILDTNKDGLSDVVWVSGAPAKDAMYLSSGDQFSWTAFEGATTPLVRADANPQLALARLRHADINGDGAIDLVVINGSTPEQYGNAVQLNDVHAQPNLVCVEDGLGARTNISYVPLTNATAVTKLTGAVFPVVDNSGPVEVVFQVSRDDGVGGQQVTTHTYVGSRVHKQGLGDLGFSETHAVSEATGVRQRHTFSQDWTLRRQRTALSATSTLANGTVIKHSTTTLNSTVTCAPSASGCLYFTAPIGVVKQSFSLLGALMATSVSNTTYDAYGNKVSSDTTVTDGYGTTTTSVVRSYTYNPDLWLMGMLTGKTVTQSASNAQPADAVTKTTLYHPDPTTGQMTGKSVMPGHPTLWMNTTYVRDAVGNKVNTTVVGFGVKSRSTTITYDSTQRFVVQTANALGAGNTNILNPVSGHAMTVTSPNGVVTKFQYDEFGRLNRTLYADGSESTAATVFCDVTAATCAVNPGMGAAPFPSAAALPVPVGTAVATTKTGRCGATMISTQDVLGRHTRTYQVGWNGSVVVVEDVYDSLGLKVKQSLPYFLLAPSTAVYTTYQYDVIRRPTIIKTADGNTTSVSYRGFNTTNVNEVGMKRTTYADAAGHVMKAVDAMGYTTTYAYDGAGQLTSAVGPDGAPVLHELWDVMGSKVWSWSADSGSTNMSYAADGKLVRTVDALGNVETTTYDVLRRPVTHTKADEAVTKVYDPSGCVGMLATVTKTFGPSSIAAGLVVKETMGYDSMCQVVSRTLDVNGTAYTEKHVRDSCGRVVSSTDAAGLTVNMAFNEHGSLTTVKDALTGLAYLTVNDMDASGHPVSTSHGAIRATAAYDPARGWMDSLTTTGAAGVTFGFQYMHDASGRVTQRVSSVPTFSSPVTEAVTYDGLSRIESTTSSNAAAVAPVALTYAPNGNILTKAGVGTYAYDATSQPHAVKTVTGSSTTQTFTYNARGDMLTGGGRTFTYWASGSVATVSAAGSSAGKGQSLTIYGSDGAVLQRVDKGLDGSVTTRLVVSPSLTVITRDGVQSCQHVPHTSVVVQSDCSSSSVASRKTFYTIRDGLDSVVGVVTANGTVVPSSVQLFDAFGATAKALVANTVTAAGYKAHPELVASGVGLVVDGARLYDPVLGRFMSADPTLQLPFHSQDLNAYSYVGNNPLNVMDPTGFGWWHHLTHAVSHFFHHLIHSIVNAIKHEWGQLLEAILDTVLLATGNPELIPLVNDAVSLVEAKLEGCSWGQMLKMAAFDAVTYGTNELPGLSSALLTPLEDGAWSALNGGSFMKGFASGALGSLSGQLGNQLHLSGNLENLAFNSVVGGLQSEVSGGSFLSGAESSAMSFETQALGKKLTSSALAHLQHAGSNPTKGKNGQGKCGGTGQGKKGDRTGAKAASGHGKSAMGTGGHGGAKNMHSAKPGSHDSLSKWKDAAELVKAGTKVVDRGLTEIMRSRGIDVAERDVDAMSDDLTDHIIKLTTKLAPDIGEAEGFGSEVGELAQNSMKVGRAIGSLARAGVKGFVQDGAADLVGDAAVEAGGAVLGVACAIPVVDLAAGAVIVGVEVYQHRAAIEHGFDKAESWVESKL